MIDPRLAWFAIGASCSAVVFGWPWHPRFSRFNRRRPYSSAAIAFCATEEDAARFRGKIINPLVQEDPPEPITPRYTPPDPRRRINHENTAPDSSEQRPRRFRRGNNSGGPTTPKPAIVPKPQFPSPREIPVDWP